MTHSVAIVVPIHSVPSTESERLSLHLLRQHLSSYRRFIVAPTGLALHGLDDFDIVRFPRRFFSSAHGYNRLLVTRRFYHAFAEYDWMLVHQLDALVFRDELSHWCEKEFDYIGAPIVIPVMWRPFNGLNGGFSLRRVRAFRKVLHGGSPQRLKMAANDMMFMQRRLIFRVAKRCLLWLHLRGLLNAAPALIFRSGCPEDIFWCELAPLLDGNFKLAPPEVAKRFAFETEPSQLYQELGRRLPFGCHAWEKHEPEFWADVFEEHAIVRPIEPQHGRQTAP